MTRILILHPEDSPRRGPWSGQRWDLIVDLGKSSSFSEEEWARHYACSILRLDSFRYEIADLKLVRDIFSAGRGKLIDQEGIDWWDVSSLFVAPEVMTVLALERAAREIGVSAELWATRTEGPVRLLSVLLERDIHSFQKKSVASSAGRYLGLVRRFSPAQIKEIFFDKYDSGYRWRSKVTARPARHPSPVVLIPSAYANVSRMAVDYAQLLPDQDFLMVATRQNAKQFVQRPNVYVANLAAYAKRRPMAEIASLQERWMKLEAELCKTPELRILSEAGELNSISGWIHKGLVARDAWLEVMEREPVCGVLCGDDSNPYTRLAVLLAARRHIPTVDFHHGALDGRYILKDLPCDTYLAKNEMERDYLVRVCNLPSERITVGAPSENAILKIGTAPSDKTTGIFFSEPYEVAGLRAEEVYREVLPPLCRILRNNGRRLTIKLHPFESRQQRWDIVREILTGADREQVILVEGPLSRELLAQAWFGITLESTTVLDCRQNGIPCFLCGWLKFSPYEYVQQYARFGAGEVLQGIVELESIPKRLEDSGSRFARRAEHSATIDPAILRRLVASHVGEAPVAKPVS